jgi:hypothetical protein
MMSGTVSNLPNLFAWAGAGGGASGLLNIAYGISGQSPRTLGQNPITALNAAEKSQTKQIAVTASQPQVARAVTAFRQAVATAKSVNDLLSNPAAMRVLLTANGLGDQAAYTALAKRALTSDTTDPKSLANTLPDKRWKSVVRTYDFAHKGLSIIQNPKVLDTIANAYAEVTWRQSLDAATLGLSDALAFRQQASSITSVDQVLGDPVMRRVVTTTLGLPLQIAFQPLEAQERAISIRLDISKFSKPAFVESFVQRYLIAAASSSSLGGGLQPNSGIPGMLI